MDPRPERQVLAVAACLGGASVALVVAVAVGAVPASALPPAPGGVLDAIPHVNAALSLAAIPTILHGWRRIRSGDVAGHRRAMLAALALFAAFLVLYLYKVALEGPTAFQGPAAVERYLYLPLLAIHVALAVVCVPLVYAAVLLAGTRPVEAISVTRHARIGRAAAGLLSVSFALGVVVYLLLYQLY